MKIRVTLMTENDKHLPGYSKEEIEAEAKDGWNTLLAALLLGCDDTAYTESCELVEE